MRAALKAFALLLIAAVPFAGGCGRAPQPLAVVLAAAEVRSHAMPEDGRTFYLSPTGENEAGDGSRERPWKDLQWAMVKKGGGATYVFLPGVYRGPLRVQATGRGTPERPTILRSEEKWKAVIVGSPDHGLSTLDADWVVIDGFEVLGARGDGIKMSGDHNTVRNCWVHSNASMGIAMHKRRGGVIESNLVEYNGTHVQFHHGIYASGEGLRIERNVVRHNASFGLHLYEEIKDSTIARNVVVNHPYRPGILVACPEPGGGNRILNNTVADNRDGIVFWNGDGELVANNIVVAKGGPSLAFTQRAGMNRVTHNLLSPPALNPGPDDLTGDPRFLDPSQGVYWLRPESPARGKGSPEHAPPADFWGRQARRESASDLGAYPYVESLTRGSVRDGWRSGWAYRFSDQEKHPWDFWRTPESLP